MIDENAYYEGITDHDGTDGLLFDPPIVGDPGWLAYRIGWLMAAGGIE